MKYKIVLGLILLSATSIQTINKQLLRVVSKANTSGNIDPVCDLLDRLDPASAEELNQSQNYSVATFRTTFGGSPAEICARRAAAGGGGAAAASGRVDATLVAQAKRALPGLLRSNPGLTANQLINELGERPDNVNGPTQNALEIELNNAKKRPIVAPKTGHGRRRPAVAPKPAAVNMTALKAEIEGAFLVNPKLTDAEINATILADKKLSPAQDKEIRQDIDYFRSMGEWRTYITGELTANRRLTISQLLDGHGIDASDKRILQKFIKEERKRLNTPPAYAPPPLPVNPPPVLGRDGAGVLPPRGVPPVTPTRLIELENTVIAGATANPSATLDDILRSNDLSRATLAESDYNRLEQAFNDAKGAPVGDLPPMPDYGLEDDLPPAAPVGGGIDIYPPPPELETNSVMVDPAPAAPVGGGGGGYGGMVRPTPVAGPGGRPGMPSGLLDGIQAHGGRGSLRKTNPDGGAPAAGDGGGAPAAGPVPFNPANPMLKPGLTPLQKQNLISEVERIYQGLPQEMPEQEAEETIEREIRANNRWLTEANIETLRTIIQEMVVNEDDWN